LFVNSSNFASSAKHNEQVRVNKILPGRGRIYRYDINYLWAIPIATFRQMIMVGDCSLFSC